jgi:putative transposase
MRKKIDPAIKAKAALDALKGEMTIAEIAAKYQVHPNMVTGWRRELLDNAAGIFDHARERRAAAEVQEKIDNLHKSIGEITMENDWLKKARSLEVEARKKLFDKDGPYSQNRQCELLGVSKSSLYYKPVPVSQRDLNIMALLDQKYTDRPYYCVRRMWKYLQLDVKVPVGRDHVRTLLRKMGIMALFPTRNLSSAERKKPPYGSHGIFIQFLNHAPQSPHPCCRRRAPDSGNDLRLAAGVRLLRGHRPRRRGGS